MKNVGNSITYVYIHVCLLSLRPTESRQIRCAEVQDLIHVYVSVTQYTARQIVVVVSCMT